MKNSKKSKKNIKKFDDYFPPRGKCAFCKHKDARHRFIDSIQGRHKAGDSIKSLSEDFDLPQQIIKEILEIKI